MADHFEGTTNKRNTYCELCLEDESKVNFDRLYQVASAFSAVSGCLRCVHFWEDGNFSLKTVKYP